MMGHKTGVAKIIQDLQPKAYPTHCHRHSLSLSVKDTTKNCKLLSDTMDTAKEIVSLITFSPKRENLRGEIKTGKVAESLRSKLTVNQRDSPSLPVFIKKGNNSNCCNPCSQ